MIYLLIVLSCFSMFRPTRQPRPLQVKIVWVSSVFDVLAWNECNEQLVCKQIINR